MPERMVPIFTQAIYSALESLESRRLLSVGHPAQDGSAATKDAGTIVMDISVSPGPVLPGQIISPSDGSSDLSGGGSSIGDGSNLARDDGGPGSTLNPGGQAHGHGWWMRGPQPPVHVTPTPTDGAGDGNDSGGAGTTDSGDLGSGKGITPPPMDQTPPPVEVHPPHVKTDPPPVDVTPPPVDVTPPPTDVNPPPVDVTPPPTDVTPPPTDVMPPGTTPPVAPPASTPPTSDSNPPPIASAPPPGTHDSTPPTSSQSGSQSGSSDSSAPSQHQSEQTASTNTSSSTSTSEPPPDASQPAGGSQSHTEHRASGSAAVASDSQSSSSAQQLRAQEQDANPAVSASRAPVVTPAEPAAATSAKNDADTFSQVKIETTGAQSAQADQATGGSTSESALERLMAMVFGQSPYGHVRGAVSADAPVGDISANDVRVEMLSDVLVDSGAAQLSASTISADAAPVAQQDDAAIVLATPPQAQASFHTPVDEGGAFNPHNIMAAVLAGITFGAIHFHRWRKRRQEAAIASARKLASMLTFDPLAVWIDHPRRRR